MTLKRLGLVLGGLIVLLIVALFGIGWYYSDQIRDRALVIEHDPLKYEIEVVALEEGRIRLRFPQDSDHLDEPATMGLEWPGGYARIGENLEINGSEVIREYTTLEGTMIVGTPVRFDKFAYPGDPERAHGIPFADVEFTSPVGELAAWRMDGSDDTWVIFVHGKGSNRSEALRMLPVTQSAGMPGLVITYRNDEGAPEDPSGYYQYGHTEWQDLEAAAQYALDNGGNDLILVGYSMGGGIVANFLYQSPLADRVVGVIFDSAMLDFGATVDLGAQQRNLPGLLTTVAKIVSSLRFGINWEALDYLARAEEIPVPILVFHSDTDETVPVRISESLAERLPQTVTYVPVAGAPHVGAWNTDPETYETAVRDFVEQVAR